MSPTSPTWHITTFYFFKALPEGEIPAIREKILKTGRALGIEGLFILAPEGLNSTCCSRDGAKLGEFKEWIRAEFSPSSLDFKDSTAPVQPFRKLKVKVRDEIVTLNRPGLAPDGTLQNHLTPAQWNETLKNEDVVLIDTRNWYEVQVGTFKGALDPKIEEFTEFPEFVEKQNIPKDKKMLIFCTGGIRCEKGILDLHERGYENVYQLEGGILKYLEQFPNDQYEGECFVFDHRVALDQKLQPTLRYELCPHCGQPGDQLITCERCDTSVKICAPCAEEKLKKETCSKNCAHWWEANPGKKGARQIPTWELNN